jgi:probable rRNA maturation factor
VEHSSMSERHVTGAERRRYLGPWRIDITVRPGVSVPLSAASLARAAAAALDVADAPRPASLGLVLSNDRELAALNAEHMGETGPTDVLSFPLLPPEAFAGRAKGRTSHGTKFVLPPGRRIHLGDIVISVQRATAQARAGRGGQTGDVRWSASDELRLLVTHGVLHVCGWDHATPKEEAAMRTLEQRLLKAGQ